MNTVANAQNFIVEQKNLTREQKQAVGLLSIGTFLEYFDLMLYVHMAVLLNELFFPKYDPPTAALLSAFAFCTTFVFRPFGALLFGWIGDNIGRKASVIITTFMMAISCFIMAILPTYAQIGISAAVIVTLCRIVQGMSSMGEVVGAKLYLTETIKPPVQYPTVALVNVFATLGTTAALGIASLVTTSQFNWRYAFWFGAGVALIGTVARTCLRETPDFVDAKRRAQRSISTSNEDPKIVDDSPILKEKVNKKTALALFFIECGWPVCFYFAYAHCGNILKDSLGYTAEQVIHQNFIVSMVEMVCAWILLYLSYYIYPLKILKFRFIIFFAFVLVCPYLLNNVTTPFELLFIQLFVVSFGHYVTPAFPVIFRHFPVFKRSTYASFMYAIARAFMYVITSFGIIYLIEYFGNWGLQIIMIPIAVGYGFGLAHFQKLEKETGHYPQTEIPTARVHLAV